MRFLRPVGVHVVDGRGLSGCDGLVEGLDLVFIGSRIVRLGMLFHKTAQVGIRAGGIVTFRHRGNGALEEEGWLLGRGFGFRHSYINYSQCTHLRSGIFSD